MKGREECHCIRDEEGNTLKPENHTIEYLQLRASVMSLRKREYIIILHYIKKENRP